MGKMWSNNYVQCRDCKTSKTPHQAKGLCKNCYMAEFNRTKEERIKNGTYGVNRWRTPKRRVKRKLTKEDLEKQKKLDGRKVRFRDSRGKLRIAPVTVKEIETEEGYKKFIEYKNKIDSIH